MPLQIGNNEELKAFNEVTLFSYKCLHILIYLSKNINFLLRCYSAVKVFQIFPY